MTIIERESEVQFTVDQSGNVTAVVISPELWHRLLDRIEDVEDRALVDSMRERLMAGPAAGGARRWQDVADGWD